MDAAPPAVPGAPASVAEAFAEGAPDALVSDPGALRTLGNAPAPCDPLQRVSNDA